MGASGRLPAARPKGRLPQTVSQSLPALPRGPLPQPTPFPVPVPCPCPHLNHRLRPVILPPPDARRTPKNRPVPVQSVLKGSGSLSVAHWHWLQVSVSPFPPPSPTPSASPLASPAASGPSPASGPFHSSLMNCPATRSGLSPLERSMLHALGRRVAQREKREAYPHGPTSIRHPNRLVGLGAQ